VPALGSLHEAVDQHGAISASFEPDLAAVVAWLHDLQGHAHELERIHMPTVA
jgi:hypothetical protein